MSTPYGTSPSGQRRGPSPLVFILGCGCALLAVLVLAIAGIAGYMLLRAPSDEPTDGPRTSTTSTEDPSVEPTDDPTGEPTDDSTVSFSASAPVESTTLDTGDETVDSENGRFVGVDITIENLGDETVALGSEKFVLYDEDGIAYPAIYGSFSTSGPELPSGESATATVYVDVSEDVVIDAISYTDAVGTGGYEVTIPVG